MGDKSKIEWTDATWNPIRGCSRVSDGCRNCYAETVANRFKGPGQPYEGLIAKGGQWNGQIKLVPEKLEDPLRWRKPRMVFVNSMSDLFHENVPDEYIDQVFSVMQRASRHTFHVLTKRPARMHEYMTGLAAIADSNNREWFDRGFVWHLGEREAPEFPFSNVWLGVSVEDQFTADLRIPTLLSTPAAIRWLSCEPLLGPIDLNAIDLYEWLQVFSQRLRDRLPDPLDPVMKLPLLSPFHHMQSNTSWPGIDWVVVGGESGKDARPMHPDWARSLRHQCQDANVPFFFKQWGEYAPSWYVDKHIPESEWMNRVGKKRAGAFLDGVEHKAYPGIN